MQAWLASSVTELAMGIVTPAPDLSIVGAETRVPV
jgi:hypothetical protein